MTQTQPKEKTHQVTFWAARGCYRKVIGGRRFYFGADLTQAIVEAAAIKNQWRALKRDGHTAWPLGEPRRPSLANSS